MSFKLKGWVAAPVLLAMLGFVVFRAISAETALASDAGNSIKLHLQGVYSIYELEGLEEAVLAGNLDEISEQVGRLVSLDEIEFYGVGIKGTSDEIVVRIKIRVDQGPPPDGIKTRYFLLRHWAATGWRVAREVGAFQYYMKLM